MADPKDPTIDEDDDDDALSASLRKHMDGFDEADPDQVAGGFDDPAQNAKAPREQSEYDEDRRKNDAAKKPDEAKPADEAKPGEVKPEPEAKVEGAKEEGAPEVKPEAKEVEGPAPEEVSTALAALPDNVRSYVETQLANHRNFMAPLLAQKDQLKALGTTPEGAVEWFMSVNDFAARKPDEYVEWVLDKTLGEDPEAHKAAVARLAAKIGMKLAPAKAEDEDNPFLSDSEKEARKQLADARAQLAKAQPQTEIGPDAPAERSMRIIQSVRTEVDNRYQPLRPHFDKVAPLMTAMIAQHVQAGKPVDRAAIIEFYDSALLAHPETKAEALQKISAAQAAEIVRNNNKAAAAATDKARKASTAIIDSPEPGLSGQNPGRKTGGETLDDTLTRHFKDFNG